MLPNRIEYLLIFFDAFGYNSGWTKLTRNRKTARFIYIAHFLLAIIYGIRIIIFAIAFFSGYKSVDLINSMLQYFSALLAYWFIVCDSVFYNREHSHFWELMGKINIFRSESYGFSFFCFVMTFAVYFITTISCLLTFIVASDDRIQFQQVIYAFVYQILIKMCEIRVFYYIFCVNELHNQLKTIDNEFKSIEPRNLKSIRSRYDSIYEMANLLNEMFGLSQVFGVSYCFYVVLSEINYIIAHYNHSPALSVLGKCSKKF